MSAELAKALVQAQAELPKVEPDAVNPHFKSKFVSLDHLIAKTRPVLNKHGLAIVQAPTHIDGQPALRTTIYHESGESTSDVMPLVLTKNDMQGLGAAVTYARRYMWAAALGIASEEDDDGTAASAPAQPAPKTAEKEKTAVVTGTMTPLGTFNALADEYAQLAPEFDAPDAKRKAAAKDDEWLGRQIKALQTHIGERRSAAEAEAKFPIPAGAKEEAA